MLHPKKTYIYIFNICAEVRVHNCCENEHKFSLPCNMDNAYLKDVTSSTMRCHSEKCWAQKKNNNPFWLHMKIKCSIHSQTQYNPSVEMLWIENNNISLFARECSLLEWENSYRILFFPSCSVFSLSLSVCAHRVSVCRMMLMYRVLWRLRYVQMWMWGETRVNVCATRVYENFSHLISLLSVRQQQHTTQIQSVSQPRVRRDNKACLVKTHPPNAYTIHTLVHCSVVIAVSIRSIVVSLGCVEYMYVCVAHTLNS